MTTGRAAVFLDRDGTIIHDEEYLADPKRVRLLPGAASAIRALNGRGVPVIVVTNQSGIARGLMSVHQYEAVRLQLASLLEREEARVDATYMCPHHPDFTGACECRKPGTLLYRRAADEHGLDLARSGYVGDRWRDVAPALALGGRGYLIEGPATSADDVTRARGKVDIVSSLEEAIEGLIRASAGVR